MDDRDSGFRGPSPDAPLGTVDGIPIQSCVGCGHCCYSRPCGYGRVKEGSLHRCDFLTHHDGRWWCGFFEGLDEGPEKEQTRYEMVIGAGCSSTLFNEWRDKPPTPEEMDAFEKEHGR